MTRKKLNSKLDQATADFMLRRLDPRVRRAIWFGTEPLPEHGLGGKLRRQLEDLGIPYWVVRPFDEAK